MHINLCKKFLLGHHLWIMHINLCKDFPHELSCVNHAH
jgi:hypothetical protein